VCWIQPPIKAPGIQGAEAPIARSAQESDQLDRKRKRVSKCQLLLPLIPLLQALRRLPKFTESFRIRCCSQPKMQYWRKRPQRALVSFPHCRLVPRQLPRRYLLRSSAMWQLNPVNPPCSPLQRGPWPCWLYVVCCASAWRHADRLETANPCFCQALLMEISMHAHVPVPQPVPPLPGTDVPNKVPPLIVPPEPGIPPGLDEPPPPEPVFPIREPGTRPPPQAV
jgi:hypothetical protein